MSLCIPWIALESENYRPLLWYRSGDNPSLADLTFLISLVAAQHAFLLRFGEMKRRFLSTTNVSMEELVRCYHLEPSRRCSTRPPSIRKRPNREAIRIGSDCQGGDGTVTRLA
jgi:hypothetical protein